MTCNRMRMRRRVLPVAALAAAMAVSAQARKNHGLWPQAQLHTFHRRLEGDVNDDGANDDAGKDDAVASDDEWAAYYQDLYENQNNNDDDAGNDNAFYDYGGDDNNDYVVSSGSVYYDYDADADGGWSEQEVDDYATDDQSLTGNGITGMKSYIQNKASNASSKAWEFYDSPPSEWTSSQWDLVFGLCFSVFALCCVGSACCAYFCVFHDDDDKDPLSPTSSKAAWSPRRPKGEPQSPVLSPVSLAASPRRFRFGGRARRGGNHRNKFNEDYYRQYQEEDEEATVGNTTVGTDVDRDDETKSTYFRDDETKSTYMPPEALVQTSSLADYTSVQREKEAMLLEEWKRAHSPKNYELADDDNDEDDDEEEEDDAEDLDEDVGPISGQLVGERKNDWDENAGKKKSKRELDERPLPGEDKLLEAREHRHNMVGYYLE